MLQEIKPARQNEGEPFRRWFCDDKIDLIVWYTPDMKVLGFQLCYKDELHAKALTWMQGRGFSHNLIDDGEERPAHHKMSPILVPDGIFAKDQIVPLFRNLSLKLERDLVEFIMKILKAYPGKIKYDSEAEDCIPTVRKTVKRKKNNATE